MHDGVELGQRAARALGKVPTLAPSDPGVVERELVAERQLQNDAVEPMHRALGTIERPILMREQKQAARIDDVEIGLRVSADSTGQWMLIADHARDDDQVVQHRGSTVLLIDPVAQSVLEGTQVDCVETADGAMELVLGAATDEDDHDLDLDDDDLDEMSDNRH